MWRGVLCYVCTRSGLAALTDEKRFEVVRAHWGIENNLSWVLDVLSDEDA